MPHLAAICEVAQMLAERLALPPSIHGLFVDLTERWDGKGPLGRAKADEIPLALRIVHVARDAVLQRMLGGEEYAVHVVRERAGHGFDPEVAACLATALPRSLRSSATPSAWEETLACEPDPRLTLDGEAIDGALRALGHFADLISPYLSATRPALPGWRARQPRDPAWTRPMLRRLACGLVHDLGRAAVHPRIWQKPAALAPDEWEHVRLHPYQTSACSPVRIPVSACAGRRRPPRAPRPFRLPPGIGRRRLSQPARFLAAADAYHAMTEIRPYRDALSAEQAADELAREASAGRLDPDAVTAVIEAAGQRRRGWSGRRA